MKQQYIDSDDPDKNCATQTTAEGPWAGHYRGKNASQETVICPPSFNVSNRVSLSELCWDGRLIGSGNPSHYLGADLMHRLTHVPSVTFGHVVHTAEGYVESLKLASTNNSLAAFNSDTLQFFALDAYARDVASAPKGCTVSMEQAKAEEAAAGGSHSLKVVVKRTTSHYPGLLRRICGKKGRISITGSGYEFSVLGPGVL
ncbi:BZ3500_MvSof-1268-A1-R1_Chr10-2g02975 [Microbotryum saponariae]|uniref:BZ3500_MvSof-1268-A1-R1_Chr10-2g02975 protein n=1 Tax=Microbotryum saponariae TaxID=289078 RepID=A0A2X0NA84_9BASI|nr:BZ3501_MvSof-1269-A2-R1_Chr10-2g02561 [Microbotryum saponariae]SDA01857.1 BZ3500_MvSof-1268-A1-R1_Chr10-2g02975 [Microbotryum saponariae]